MMAKTFHGAYTADLDGDFVVFLIGMRVNKPWAVRRWWPTFAAMRPMIQELEARPELGLLHASSAGSAARSSSSTGAPSSSSTPSRATRTASTCRRGRSTTGAARASSAVGIWHETYRCAPASTRRSTATCRAAGSRSRAATSPSEEGAERRPADRRAAEDLPAVVYHGD